MILFKFTDAGNRRIQLSEQTLNFFHMCARMYAYMYECILTGECPAYT